jgi:hypothetical protein
LERKKGAGMKVEKVGVVLEMGRNKIEMEKFFIDIREDIKV